MLKAFFKFIVSATICGSFRHHRWSFRSRVIRPRPRSGLHDGSTSPSISCRIDHGFSLNIDTPMNFVFGSGHEPRIATVVSPCRKIANSLAMVKDSENPYMDFKASMLQMVFEKEIDTESDLEELLKCFLKMNSPSNHRAIAQAFMEIWDGIIHNRPTSSSFNGERN